MAEALLFGKFLLALALGAVIGFERERFAKKTDEFTFGGIRTFTFISLFGAISVYLSQEYFEWFIVPMVLGLIGLLAVSYNGSLKLSKGKSIGMTGEIVAVLSFLYGAIAMGSEPIYAIVLTIITTALLYSKQQLHECIKSISKEETYSTLIFATIAFVILPFLPNQTYGPLNVLNPHKIWLMVVFISGMGFIGYIAIKVLGSKKGIGLTGLLGGLVSSTAVTLSFSERSKKIKSEKIIHLFVFATLVANAIMLIRVLIEVYVVNKAVLKPLLIPILLMTAVAGLSSILLWIGRNKKTAEKEPEEINHTSPLTLGPAIKFGILFGAVLLAVKAAQLYLGTKGIYLASAISGFVDVDAITLSMASLSKMEISTKVAATAITIAVISNTAIKFGYAAIFGSKNFRNQLGIMFALVVLAGIVGIFIV